MWKVCIPGRAVHPHTRGERRNGSDEAVRADGSSPHPWGTRLIPCARLPPSGSSPHPWGTLWWQHLRADRRRFIPTPVGNAQVLGLMPLSPTVHPHTRGERLPSLSPVQVSNGSSPHPWGTRCPAPPQAAHAAVHPHTRGERWRSTSATKTPTGSSPHPWGTLEHCSPAACVSRFIPTPVGNATAPWQTSLAKSVHPHTRGERLGKPATGVLDSGSSPHPWGTQNALGEPVLPVRFIPTPVGNA